MLIKRICQSLNKPVFEVMSWPYDELLYWQVFFSIDDNGIEDEDPTAELDPEEAHVAKMKGIFK